MDTRPIGMFDSGVGGLTVLSEIRKKLPYEDYIYLGDTKNFPYGSKTKQNIVELSKKNIEFLINKGVKLIVIACGTATSQALEEVKNVYDIPIIGIIEPTILEIEKDVQHNKIFRLINKIGVIATEGTIKSMAWEKNIKEKKSETIVINKACPLLAQMAEEGWTDNEIARLTIREYMKPFKNENIDKLILGCTHYPLFEKLIREELGENVEIINTGEKVAVYLENKFKEENNGKKGIVEIYLTEYQEKFKDIASKLFKESIELNQVN